MNEWDWFSLLRQTQHAEQRNKVQNTATPKPAFYSKMLFQGLWALFFFFLIKNDFQKQTKSGNKKQEGDSIGKNIVCIIIKALLFLLSSRLLFSSSSRFTTLPVTGIWSLLGPISPVTFLPYRTMLMPCAFAP
jgi:hypothetical protein